MYTALPPTGRYSFFCEGVRNLSCIIPDEGKCKREILFLGNNVGREVAQSDTIGAIHKVLTKTRRGNKNNGNRTDPIDATPGMEGAGGAFSEGARCAFACAFRR